MQTSFSAFVCLIFNSPRDGGASLTFTHHTLNLGVPITQVTHPLNNVSNSLQIAVFNKIMNLASLTLANFDIFSRCLLTLGAGQVQSCKVTLIDDRKIFEIFRSNKIHCYIFHI